MLPDPKTKIVATVGPASDSPEMLERLMRAGLNVVRLNFSHGDYEEHGQRIKNLRNVMSKTGKKAAILLDTIPPTASVQIQVNTLTVRGSVPDEVEKVLDGSLVSVRAGTNAARFSAFLPDRSQKIEWACPLEDVEAVWQGNTNTWVVRLVGCIHRIQGDGYTPAYLSGRRPPRSS